MPRFTPNTLEPPDDTIEGDEEYHDCDNCGEPVYLWRSKVSDAGHYVHAASDSEFCDTREATVEGRTKP